jgi:hypothetical protein
MADLSGPIAVIGSGHAGMAAIINLLIRVARNHPPDAAPVKVLIVNTRLKQPPPETLYPLNNIAADDLHPFDTDMPPPGFPTFGTYLREMSKEDPRLASALVAPTYAHVTAYIEFITELAIIAAGEKIDMEANRKPIDHIDLKVRGGPAAIHYRDGTVLEMAAVFSDAPYADSPLHLGGA